MCSCSIVFFCAFGGVVAVDPQCGSGGVLGHVLNIRVLQAVIAAPLANISSSACSRCIECYCHANA
eukprot:m.3418 g.3418  ORF g.3418 m.3418 type:complete len:66 (+) comp2787_c0_seq1:149-346(+)